ncbi:MAG: hypothetical protein H0U67_07790 [Gemmatimonadetes bacterium]|nr:hypothetical protein [Gemmatimonadota bacterium]
MTESFERLRPSWIAFGWFIAAAVTSLVLFGLIVLGVISDDPQAEGAWVALAFLIGFAVAGFFVGVRAGISPILHGVGMGLFSLVVFWLANLFGGETTGQTAWTEISTVTAGWLILLQTVAAIVGTRAGVRWRRKGG